MLYYVCGKCLSKIISIGYTKLEFWRKFEIWKLVTRVAGQGYFV